MWKRLTLVSALTLLTAGCTLHDKLGELYPTYFETVPAPSAFKPGRIYRTSRIEFLNPATSEGLQRIVFGAPCRPKIEAEANTAFSETFTQSLGAGLRGNVEILGVASLRNDKEIVGVVREVTMTVKATHLVIGAEEIAKAQIIAKKFCPNTLRNGQMITQAIVADVDVNVTLNAGVDVNAALTAKAIKRVTGSVGFGVKSTSNTHTTAEGVIIAVKFEAADTKL